MTIYEELLKFMIEKAKEFGGRFETNDNEFNDFRFRNNTGDEVIKQGGGFIGLIRQNEDLSGPFHDFSIVLFPPSERDKGWLLCLGIGSLGFKNDDYLASIPGTRRLFSSLIAKNSGYIKTSLLDIESSLPKAFVQKISHLNKTLQVNDYKKLLPVCQILNDPFTEKSKESISSFIAAFAYISDWASNKQERDAISKAVNIKIDKQEQDDEKIATDLLLQRRFLILTGAPGTGKTRLAKLICNDLKAKSFFIQFHAETNYSDFIYGIKPTLKESTLLYEGKEGVFVKAIKYAKSNPKEKTILIIDEINRANLANILGPIFYLFEYRMHEEEANVEIDIADEIYINRIPDNLFMIGTMNTADRSLAVVDFALRRRFAWFDLKPRVIDDSTFYKNDFNEIKDIFYRFAVFEEMNLMPGQGYFLANSEDEMKKRIEYELLPLIREYIQEGLLQTAKEDFSNYFMERIGKPIFD